MAGFPRTAVGTSWMKVIVAPGDQGRIDVIIPRAVRALESVGWHVELLAGPTTVRFWLRAASSSCPP